MVQGSGCGVWCVWLGVWCVGFGFWGLGFVVWGWGSWFKVKGLEFTPWGADGGSRARTRGGHWHRPRAACKGTPGSQPTFCLPLKIVQPTFCLYSELFAEMTFLSAACKESAG